MVTVSYLVHYDTLLQNATNIIAKCTSILITKCVNFITKWVNFITKCDVYYKMRQCILKGTSDVLISKYYIRVVTAWKVFKYGVSSGPYLSVFSANAGKYGPEKTPYVDTFHAVSITSTELMESYFQNQSRAKSKICQKRFSKFERIYSYFQFFSHSVKKSLKGYSNFYTSTYKSEI